jgi:hypothetical protein
MSKNLLVQSLVSVEFQCEFIYLWCVLLCLLDTLQQYRRLVILDGTTGRICSTKARNDVLQATPGERNACLKAWTNMSASASSTNTFDPGEGSLCTVS